MLVIPSVAQRSRGSRHATRICPS